MKKFKALTWVVIFHPNKGKYILPIATPQYMRHFNYIRTSKL